jgi:hypothetical protein
MKYPIRSIQERSQRVARVKDSLENEQPRLIFAYHRREFRAHSWSGMNGAIYAHEYALIAKVLPRAFFSPCRYRSPRFCESRFTPAASRDLLVSFQRAWSSISSGITSASCHSTGRRPRSMNASYVLPRELKQRIAESGALSFRKETTINS